MKFIIGCSYEFKLFADEIAHYLERIGHQVIWAKSHDIMIVAHEISYSVSRKFVHKGIIINDFAQLSFMIAAKYPHTIVAPLFNEYSAELTIKHNNSNIICFGAAIIGVVMAKEMLKIYLHHSFDGGRHLRRINMIDQMIKE